MDSKEKFDYIDFLSDSKFLEWRLFQTEELDYFWADYIKANPQKKQTLEQAIEKFKTVRLNEKHLSSEATDKLYERILYTVSKKRKKRKLYYYSALIACSILLIAAVTTIFFKGDHPEIESKTIIGESLPSQDIQLISGANIIDINQNADLVLSDEGKVEITKESQVQTSKVELNNNMNRLVVPYGKRSTLLLADGSKIWLNSGTELEFPTNFVSNERRINVISGEIYIEVSEDKEKFFYVHTSEFYVHVHGTKFNVSCYKNSESSVVLVQGKVSVQSMNDNLILNPGELLSIENGKMIHEHVDVNEYISWKDGVFVFKHIKISELLKKIGRYYNIDFKENKSTLQKRTCTGKLYLSQDVEQVMNVVSVISNTSYKKIGNTIYITDKNKE
ncbi:MAG: FecR family protein [Dysgonomonas sp.]|nr:FecR family protein [Dysgonomonas sp.]